MFIRNPFKSAGKHIGLPALATSRSLIALAKRVQEHRGASSAWLAGDTSFAVRLKACRAEIEGLLPDLRAGFGLETEERCPCFNLHDWRLLRFRWQELLEELEKISIQENIERHTRLVAQLLDWLAAVGESRIELPAGSRLPAGLARDFANRLPALAECLGQARALGASVAAQGGCSPVARVRLLFLVARAETLLGQAAAGGGRDGTAAEAERLARAMAGMVRSELLAGSGVRITPERYFEAATQAIGAVYAWIERSGTGIERALRDGPPAGREGRRGGLPAFG